MNEQLSALLVAQPGPLRDALGTLLRAIPNLHVAFQAHDSTTLLEQGQTQCPDLVIVDFDEQQVGLLDTLIQIKCVCPTIRTIALIDQETQAERCYTVGVDVVVVKGMLANRLLERIEALLYCMAPDKLL